jgi:beta-lactamase regulating signal transducer with metallopeptidase domain
MAAMDPNIIYDGLIRSAIQGSVAIAAVWGLLAVWRKCPHTLRVWLWRIALVKMLLAALWAGPVTFRVLPPQAHPVRNVFALRPPVRQGYEDVDIGKTVELSEKAAKDYNVAEAPPEPLSVTLADVMVIVWLAGVSAAVGLSLYSILRWRRSRTRGEAPAADHLDELRRLSQQAGLRRVPALLISDTEGPMVTGLIRPLIILPRSDGNDETGDSTRLILAHEISHISRRDLLWEILPTVAGCLFWFNPLVYVAKYQAGLAREMVCDAAAVRLTQSTDADYARMLVEFVSNRRAAVTCVGMSEAYGAIRARILSVANPIEVSRARFAAIGLTMAVVAVALIVPWSLTKRGFSQASQNSASPVVEDTYKGLRILPGEYRLEWDMRDPRLDDNYTRDSYDPALLDSATRSKIVGLISRRARNFESDGLEIILDETRGSGEGYNVAYVFPQERLHDGKVGLRTTWRVPLQLLGDTLTNDHFRLELKLGTQQQHAAKPAQFCITLRMDASGTPRDASFVRMGRWYGHVRTTKGQVEVETRDENWNGDYNGVSTYTCKWRNCCGHGRDVVKLGEMKSSSGLSGWYTEDIVAARGIAMYAGRLYVVKVSPTGDRVWIDDYTGKAGELTVSARDGFGKPAGFSLSLAPTGYVFSGFGSRSVAVPPGNYSCSAIVGPPNKGAERRDPDMDTPAIDYDPPKTTISAGKSTALNLGGPLEFSIKPNERPIRVHQGHKHIVSFFLVAAGAGPVYTNFSYGTLTPIRVVNAKGKIVKRLDSDLMCGFRGRPQLAMFDAGKLAAGDYTVTIGRNLGPYSPPKSTSAKLVVTE